MEGVTDRDREGERGRENAASSFRLQPKGADRFLAHLSLNLHLYLVRSFPPPGISLLSLLSGCLLLFASLTPVFRNIFPLFLRRLQSHYALLLLILVPIPPTTHPPEGTRRGYINGTFFSINLNFFFFHFPPFSLFS